MTNNSSRAAKGSNVVTTTKAAGNAKRKGPTKAERLRTNLAKANASAAKAMPSADFAKLSVDLVMASKRNDGAARTLAHWMNHQFAEPMKAFRCHWSAFTPANCRSDNEKAVLARIEGYRKEVQELALVKGLSNTNKPWSDMKRISFEVFAGGTKRERVGQPLDKRQKETLVKLYKACMKEERPTDEELAVNDAIGRLLATTFKVDLSTLA